MKNKAKLNEEWSVQLWQGAEHGLTHVIHPYSLEPLMEGKQQINMVHNHQDSTVSSILWT